MDLRGETAEHALPGLIWRPMTAGDLDGVVVVAAEAFPGHFEDRTCFAERLTLFPDGCRVLADEAGVHGYLFAYPWRADDAPPLNSLIGDIPADAACLYLHDLALTRRLRGGGHARRAVDAVATLAHQGGWPVIALVAVNDAEAFWARHGFRSRQTPALATKLVSYGPDARYMVRDL